MVKKAFRDCKNVIRSFMRDRYTDKHLAQLIDHARSGGLAHYSCCCFAGIPTAKHEDGKLRSTMDLGHGNYGYDTNASIAFNALGDKGNRLREERRDSRDVLDARRRRIIIPMAMAEIRRRQRSNIEVKETAHEVCENRLHR